MKKIAISVGDLNGVGMQIALLAHEQISALCEPIYCISEPLLEQVCQKLHTSKPSDFRTSNVAGDFNIQKGTVCKTSGKYSFDSFVHAIELVTSHQADAVVTLPIHKEAWSLAGLEHKGHTDYLRKHFDQEAIMMLGCEQLFVALYTEHIPLQNVAQNVDTKTLTQFLLNFYSTTHFNNVAVLGLNPHAGDGGVLGDEERYIVEAIAQANTHLNKDIFFGPVVPDTAFSPKALANCNRIVAMYHDQGLTPLKALYFDESINVSLHLPIVRTSVDHGTAFDIAYEPTVTPSTKSYINAVKYALEQTNLK